MGNSQLRGHDMLNKLTFAAATTALVLGASAASAQSIPFAEVDTDGDMMLSNDELVAAFGEDGAALLMQDDSDGPDYRDSGETTLQPNDTETEGFLEEGEDN